MTDHNNQQQTGARVARYAEAIRTAISYLSDETRTEDWLDEARAVVAVADAEQAELQAEVEQKERLLRTMDHWAEVAETCERKSNEWAARLRAVEALPAKWKRLLDTMLAPQRTPGTANVRAFVESATRDLSAVLARSQAPQAPAEQEGLAEVIALIWREHSNCNWVSTGHHVQWSCGIIHGGPIHMQPTTRDRHVAALVMTQVKADEVLARLAPSPRPDTADDEGVS